MIAVRVNVRALAEFFCEGGDLCPAAGAAEAMRQGTAAHQIRQTEYGPEETREASLSGEYLLESGALRLFGRADGVRRVRGQWCIEEIKWIAHPLENDQGREVHWHQACLYALLLCDRDKLTACGVRLVYIDGEGTVTVLERIYARETLYAMMAEAGEPFLRFQAVWNDSRTRRMQTAAALAFPFGEFRPGQQSLSRNAFIALREGKSLVCEAPTGLGKTMAVLFAAARALGDGHIQRAFFLTARGTGRQAAESALYKIEETGCACRWVSLQAKAKMCVMDRPQCDPEICPRARGYFDRRRSALLDTLDETAFSSERIREIAEVHGLCPFEFSLDLAETCDFVIGDYNYAFDPRVRLERFFQTKTGAALLVDEAHNLIDRGREMYSAWLKIEEVRAIRREWGRQRGRKDPAYRVMSRFLSAWKQGFGETEQTLGDSFPPEAIELAEMLRSGLENCGAVDCEAYWSAVWFARAARERCADSDRAVWGKDGAGLWCMEPARRFAGTLAKCHGAVFFSATLRPIDFYQNQLGAEDGAMLTLPSPFPRENLQIRCVPLSTRFRDRARNMPRLAALIREFVLETPGNVLVCFPSYAYLEAARELMREEDSRTWLYQQRDMDEAARQAFLSAFDLDVQRPAAGFVTMGGRP